jgi:uncharacterized membrane protein
LQRLPIVDIARGVAIAQMIAYHFCYDLNYFQWIHVALTRDAPWIAWRTAIVTQFLFLVGISLSLRASGESSRTRTPSRFWKRWGQIAFCAALVSAGSWWIFGQRWIWFGVLHFVAVAQLLLRDAARWGPRNFVLGVLVLAMGTWLQFAAFDSNALSWVGFAPNKPRTEDFVPLFPWLGVVLLGIGAGNFWQQSAAPWAQWLRDRGANSWQWITALGRWPLTVYMLHQPLLFGALYAVHKLVQNLG